MTNSTASAILPRNEFRAALAFVSTVSRMLTTKEASEPDEPGGPVNLPGDDGAETIDTLIEKAREIMGCEVCPEPVPVESTPAPVYLAKYEHKHGEDSRIFATEEGAERWRREIASSYWSSCFRDVESPDDPKERADLYFANMEEREWFNVEKVDFES